MKPDVRITRELLSAVAMHGLVSGAPGEARRNTDGVVSLSVHIADLLLEVLEAGREP